MSGTIVFIESKSGYPLSFQLSETHASRGGWTLVLECVALLSKQMEINSSQR